MLDDWLERMLREPPEKRAKGQLRDLGNATRKTVKALREHPNNHLTGDILHTHTVQVAAIARRGTKLPPARCQICGKVLPGPPRDFWTNNLVLKLCWAVCVAVLVVILSQVIDWWALVVFPIGGSSRCPFCGRSPYPRSSWFSWRSSWDSAACNRERRNKAMAYTAGSKPPCPHARTLMQISEQTIFNKITPQTTPDQYTAAAEILRQLRDRLEAQVDMFHYPAATGDHWCVRDVYDHAVLALTGLAAMHQQEGAPPPRQQLISREGIVIDLEDKIQTNTEATDLGTDDSPVADRENQWHLRVLPKQE